MEKYAKVIDAEKGLCEVGTGDPEAVFSKELDFATGKEKVTLVKDFYQSLGMELMEVEQAYNGQWYVAGKAPAAPEKKEVRIFSKYKLCDATLGLPFTAADGTETTVWAAFQNFLEASGKKPLWDNIVEVSESNPHFQEAIPIAIANFGEELVNKVLNAAVERVDEVLA